MKLKLDENGHVVVVDGKPVYVHDDGKEIPFDAPQATQKIAQLNAEARDNRVAKEQAEAKLKTFEGIFNVPEYNGGLKKDNSRKLKKRLG